MTHAASRELEGGSCLAGHTLQCFFATPKCIPPWLQPSPPRNRHVGDAGKWLPALCQVITEKELHVPGHTIRRMHVPRDVLRAGTKSICDQGGEPFVQLLLQLFSSLLLSKGCCAVKHWG